MRTVGSETIGCRLQDRHITCEWATVPRSTRLINILSRYTTGKSFAVLPLTSVRSPRGGGFPVEVDNGHASRRRQDRLPSATRRHREDHRVVSHLGCPDLRSKSSRHDRESGRQNRAGPELFAQIPLHAFEAVGFAHGNQIVSGFDTDFTRWIENHPFRRFLDG